MGSTSHNDYADLNIGLNQAKALGWSSSQAFEMMLVETTLLNRFWDLTTPLYRGYTLNDFDKLVEISELKGPKFVFTHIFCPHGPYVFDANGETIKAVSVYTEAFSLQRQKYLNQVQFINGKVKTLVDEILSKSQMPPIIIIQGDHGSRLCCEQGFTSIECMQDTFGILNAYYLPNGGETVLYRAISPVNSFRVVFNSYFDTEYELLADQCYNSNVFEYPYEFVNVTDEVIHE